MQRKHHNFCFTLNNYTDEELETLDRKLLIFDGDEVYCNKQVSYLICGAEVGEECHTPHLQGYIRFHNAKTFSQVKKFMGDRMHIDAMRGTPEQNIAYCSKDGEYIEFGEMPKQGSRNDIKRVRDQIINGENINDVIMNSTSYQSARHAELLYKYKTMKQPQPQIREVKWIVCKFYTAGVKRAIQDLTDYYIAPSDFNDWNAYTGQETIIINIDNDPKHNLLKLISPIPFQLNTKGGLRWLQSTTIRIIVTSKKYPLMFYDDEDSTDLLTNIDEIIEIK